jgi:hypothetical protein
MLNSRKFVLFVTNDVASKIHLDASIFLAALDRSADDSPRFERNAVKIFSLASSRFIHTLRFPAAVHALHSSATALVVSMRTATHILDPRSLAHRWAATTAPQPDLHAAVALGSRWVALCAPSPPHAAPADSVAARALATATATIVSAANAAAALGAEATTLMGASASDLSLSAASASASTASAALTSARAVSASATAPSHPPTATASLTAQASDYAASAASNLYILGSFQSNYNCVSYVLKCQCWHG